MEGVVHTDGIDPDVLARAAREEADKIAVRRVGIATGVVTLALPVYAALDRILGQPNILFLDVIKIVTAGIPLAAVAFLRTQRGRGYARAITFALVVVMTIASGASAVISRNYAAHDMLATMVTLFTGALIPWGLAYQLAAIAVLALSAIVVTVVVAGSLAPLLGYPALVAVATGVMSIYVAREIIATINALTEQNLHRNRAQQDLEEEARVSAALAHAGRALIACTERSALLKRLCELTLELTPCEYSWTILREGDSGDYRIAAYCGPADALVESMGVLNIPAAELESLMTELRAGVVVRTEPGSSPMLDHLRRHLGIHARMYAPLWQGEELRGAQAATVRNQDVHFSPQQKRLLVGLGQLASLALETNRLIEELERASRFKSDFVASMSHELRTPLNVILGYQDLLLDGTFGRLTAEQDSILRRSEKNGRELLDLITATLDLSRMDSHGPGLDMRDVALRDLLDELREELTVGWENAQVTVAWEADAELSAIRTDRIKLRMVLKNLIHNALKFTPRGSVQVRASRDRDGVVFTVADTGIGIAAEELDKIFDAFHQVEPSKSFAGVGLGLYIVRRLVGALEGTVEIESQVGIGSTFRVWLPAEIVQSRISMAMAR